MSFRRCYDVAGSGRRVMYGGVERSVRVGNAARSGTGGGAVLRRRWRRCIGVPASTARITWRPAGRGRHGPAVRDDQLELFEADATRAMSVLHWGTGANEWPWGGIGATTSGLIRTRGAFSHYSISTSSLQGNSTSGLGDLLALANNYAIRTAQPAGTTNGDAANQSDRFPREAVRQQRLGRRQHQLNHDARPSDDGPAVLGVQRRLVPVGHERYSGCEWAQHGGNSPEWGPTIYHADADDQSHASQPHRRVADDVSCRV
jgi:hypothetical protein